MKQTSLIWGESRHGLETPDKLVISEVRYKCGSMIRKPRQSGCTMYSQLVPSKKLLTSKIHIKQNEIDKDRYCVRKLR